jgi:hypothetical protein
VLALVADQIGRSRRIQEQLLYLQRRQAHEEDSLRRRNKTESFSDHDLHLRHELKGGSR